MHHDPGFGVIERMPRAFVAGGIVLYGEQVREGEPDLRGEQFSQRLCRTSVSLVSNEVFFKRGLQLGVTADLDVFVIHADRTEIFGKTLIEPSLSGRIVEV